MIFNPTTSRNDVIEFEGTIYAWVKNKLYGFDSDSCSWSIVSKPEGLILTPEGVFIEDSELGLEYLTKQGGSLCHCPNDVLFSRGCQCGGV